MNLPDELTRRRVSWRCRRGMRELDLLLLGFLDKAYDRLTARERSVFERLLGHSDAELAAWLMGRAEPTERDLADVIEKIRAAAVS